MGAAGSKYYSAIALFPIFAQQFTGICFMCWGGYTPGAEDFRNAGRFLLRGL